MKNGYQKAITAGAIAGVIAGLVVSISSIGLPTIGFPILSTPLKEIVFNLIWGIVFGIIYSKIHSMIPGKGMIKGFYYGLLVFLFTAFRDAIWWAAYGVLIYAISLILLYIFASIIYGLVLGILYDGIAPKLRKFDLTKGAHAGTIAGILGGLAAYLMQILDNILHISVPQGFDWMEITIILSQLLTHVGIHTIYGAAFGVIFAIVYSLVPKKNISKGIVYGLIAYLITDFHAATYLIFNGEIPGGIATAYIGFVAFLVYGIVLGYLFRK